MLSQTCQCSDVRELKENIQRHEKKLSELNVQLAVISTKLSIVLGILSAVGVALCGIIVKMMFGI